MDISIRPLRSQFTSQQIIDKFLNSRQRCGPKFISSYSAGFSLIFNWFFNKKNTKHGIFDGPWTNVQFLYLVRADWMIYFGGKFEFDFEWLWVPFQVDTSPTISDHFRLFLYQSIALDEGYILFLEFKLIKVAVWPQIHEERPWVGVFLRHLRGFDVILRPNTRSDRLGLKKHFIERFKSYRTVCSFVELDKKQPR